MLIYDTIYNKGEISFKIWKKNLWYELFNYKVETINSFYAVTGLRTARNHHRLALLACQPDAKYRMVDCFLFRKEDDFCTTFPIGHWLADIHIIGQTAHSFCRKLLSVTK